MLDWNDLRTFAEVARRGSLAAAARALAVHPATVSRRIAAAEDALGAPLFLRSTRGLTLTQAGARLVGSLEPLVDVIDDVARRAVERDDRPVRVAVTENGARLIVAHAIPRLLRGTPVVELELLPGNAVVDLARGDADLAIRVVPPAGPGLVQQRLGEVRYGLYASAAYLKASPPWRDGGGGHRVVAPSAELAAGPEARWLAAHAHAARVTVRASSLVTLAVAAEHGAGLCVLPTNLAMFHPALALIRRLPELPGRPVWLVTHRQTRREPRVRRAVEIVGAAFRASLKQAA